MNSIRIAELSQSLRVAIRVIAQQDPRSPALALITRTLIRDGQNLSFQGTASMKSSFRDTATMKGERRAPSKF